MNPAPLPEILTRQHASPQVELPLVVQGVLRYVWEGKFGAMLIEVKDGALFVNGKHVEQHVAGGDSAAVTRTFPPCRRALNPAA